jgi:hypothetical protein
LEFYFNPFIFVVLKEINLTAGNVLLFVCVWVYGFLLHTTVLYIASCLLSAEHVTKKGAARSLRCGVYEEWCLLGYYTMWLL